MIRIVVRGTPAPQGSKRHVGNGRMIEMSKAVAPWREAVRAETQRAMGGRQPMTGYVNCVIVFLLARPKGHYRTDRNDHLLRPGAPGVPVGRPDLDKLARAVLDGLTMGGAWKDDSQVVALQVRKSYAAFNTATGCKIELYEGD